MIEGKIGATNLKNFFIKSLLLVVTVKAWKFLLEEF